MYLINRTVRTASAAAVLSAPIISEIKNVLLAKTIKVEYNYCKTVLKRLKIKQKQRVNEKTNPPSNEILFCVSL